MIEDTPNPMSLNNNDLKKEYTQPGETRRWDSCDTQGDWNTLETDTRYLIYIDHPIFNTISKFRRRATSRTLQYYGATGMMKLSSRRASLCHPSASATLADTNLRHVTYSREEPPRRRTTVGDAPCNKEQHPLYPKIHIPKGNPGMYPGCPLTTANHALKPSHFRPPTWKTSQSIPARTQT